MEQEEKKEKIYQTKKQLLWEVFRFLLVGGLATVSKCALADRPKASLCTREPLSVTAYLTVIPLDKTVLKNTAPMPRVFYFSSNKLNHHK